MSKLVEAAAEFLARDTSTKGNEFSEAMHPKKKMEAMHPDGMHRMPDGTMMKNSDHKKKMEAIHPMKKGKKEMEENFLLSQEEFQSLSEEDQEYYVNQLIELKNGMMKSKMGKRSKMM